MKKILAIMFLSLMLTSCFGKKAEEDKIELNSGTGEIIADNTPKVTYDWINIDISEKGLEKQREDIDLDDIDLLYTDTNKEFKNPLLAAWKKFLKNIDETKKVSLTKRIDGWIEFEDYKKEVEKIPAELKRNFRLEMEIIDAKTGEKVKKWNVYVNGIKFGSFEDGKFEKEFVWPKWIEKFNMIVRTDNYADFFIDRNSLYSNWKLLVADAKLQKLDVLRDIELNWNKEIKEKDFSVKIDNCTLVDSDWDCYKWTVKAKINHIKWSDVNNNKDNLWLNMKAITKEWKIIYLWSWGMAFTEFITPDGEILSVSDDKKMKITYNVTDSDIRFMKTKFYWNWEKNGYWLYDKEKNLWIEKDAKFDLDEKNKTWTVYTSEIY